MSHGAPDYSNVRKEGLVFRIDDMAELAVRLGSIVSFDRRGDVYWFYGFNEGIGDFVQTKVGANSNVELVSTMYEHPPFSCRVKVSASVGGYCSIKRRLAIPKTTNIGAQASLRISAATKDIRIYLVSSNGTNRYESVVALKPLDQKIQIYDGSLGWVDVATNLPAYTNISHFVHMKVVMNIDTNKYVRVMLDNTEYDVSTNVTKTVADTTARSIFTEIMNVTNESTIDSVFVDNIIVTVNE